MSEKNLLDAIRAEVKNAGTFCVAGKIITSLPANERKIIQQAYEEGIPCTAIARALTKQRNLKVSDLSFQRHTSGRCKCGFKF